jgi:hypothetical protein
VALRRQRGDTEDDDERDSEHDEDADDSSDMYADDDEPTRAALLVDQLSERTQLAHIDVAWCSEVRREMAVLDALRSALTSDHGDAWRCGETLLAAALEHGSTTIAGVLCVTR